MTAFCTWVDPVGKGVGMTLCSIVVIIVYCASNARMCWENLRRNCCVVVLLWSILVLKIIFSLIFIQLYDFIQGFMIHHLALDLKVLKIYVENFNRVWLSLGILSNVVLAKLSFTGNIGRKRLSWLYIYFIIMSVYNIHTYCHV